MTITYNEPITFGSAGNALGLNCSGIDFSEDGSEFLDLRSGRRNGYSIAVRTSGRRDATGGHAVSGRRRRHRAKDLHFSWRPVRWLLHPHRSSVNRFPVSRNIVSGRTTRLSLVIPNAASPRSLNLSEDLRELGIYLSSITFRTTP